MRARTTLTLIGFGTATLFGAYLYKKPALRRRMWSALTMRRALRLLAREVRHDATDASISFMTSFFATMAKNLRAVQGVMRRRFIRNGRAILNKAEEAGDMMDEQASRMEGRALLHRIKMKAAA